MAQLAKNPPAGQEDQFPPLDQEDPLKKETATHSSILDWEIPWTEESGGLQFMGSQRVGPDLQTKPPPHLIPWGCRKDTLLPAYPGPKLSGKVGLLAAALTSDRQRPAASVPQPPCSRLRRPEAGSGLQGPLWAAAAPGL